MHKVLGTLQVTDISIIMLLEGYITRELLYIYKVFSKMYL